MQAQKLGELNALPSARWESLNFFKAASAMLGLGLFILSAPAFSSLKARVAIGAFARWMLITHDRIVGKVFKLTQEFSAQMLGVHCPSVILGANQFQHAAMIFSNRGGYESVTAKESRKLACECYFDVRSKFHRLMGIHYG